MTINYALPTIQGRQCACGILTYAVGGGVAATVALDTNKALLDEVCKTIAKHLGENSAKTFRTFFQDEPTDGITRALEELLVNFVGDQHAKAELTAILRAAQAQGGVA